MTASPTYTDMHAVSATEYRAEDGTVMRRSWENSPNGNPLCGRWVLLNPAGDLIDFDRYRNDLAGRHRLCLIS